MDTDQAGPNPPGEPARRPRLNWILLIALLLAPAILTCLSVLLDKTSNGPAPAVGMITGAIGGVACGIVLGCYVGRSAGAKVILSFLFATVCGIASISIAAFGCLATGYSLNFH